MGNAAKGPKPGFCTGGIDQASGLEVYSYAVSAVASAQDALERAAARLDESEIPGPDATTADADALIAQMKAQGWSFKTAAALRVLQRQRDYLAARDDLARYRRAQSQARQYAAKGVQMSVSAQAVLKAGC